MLSITIRQQTRPGEQWQLIGEVTAPFSKTTKLRDSVASESDLISLQLRLPVNVSSQVRVFVGSVLVASTIPADRVVLIDYDDTNLETPPLVCRGRFLADWVGLTDMAIDLQLGDANEWKRVFVLPLAVTAGKIATEQFNQLFSELEHDAAAVLLDVHGKTQVGLKALQSISSSAPVAVLQQLRATVIQLGGYLHKISRNPASRMRPQWNREPALMGQAISESTLAAACSDPDILVRCGSTVRFREHLCEQSRRDFRIAEHQVIADFCEFLKVQVDDLRFRIDLEIADRRDRKQWRDVRTTPGRPSWWETEDFPRIEELGRCRHELSAIRRSIDDCRKLPFIPVGTCMNQRPISTPLFRNDANYRRIFQLIVGHFQTYQATLDTHHLLTRARSLPVLYEWWCAVQIIRVLARLLSPLPRDSHGKSIISTQLTQEGQRFTIEFTPDQEVAFTDKRGSRVRFRYQPVYKVDQGGEGTMVGPLDSGTIRTPDMTLEVYPASARQGELPMAILVFDAKYSAKSQWDKLAEVGTKYSKLGDLRTGSVLSRQVWALTPSAPERVNFADGLRCYCTVDNDAFWSEEFDPRNPVIGAVQTRPVRPGEFDPVEALIVALLSLHGVESVSTTEMF